MKEKFSWHRFISVPFLLGLFFIAGLSGVKAVTLYGVTTTNQLVRFDSATPTTVTTVGAITGLQAAENILGIDFRPADGQLFGLGSSSRIYRINITTGAATAIGAAGAFTLTGTNFGFDFNPVPDRIRIVSNTGQNIRVNPNDGTLTGTDGNLNPGTPSITASAYSNNFAGTTTTTLFDIDTNSNTLFRQDPPNSGTLVAVGPLGITTTSGVNGFDIASGSGTAFAVLTVGATQNLYTINLTTGAATLVGAIGNGLTLRGLAVGFGSPASGTDRGTALDFDGDRRADYAVFREQGNNWFIRRSTDTGFYGVNFGTITTDILTPGDYDGDGRADVSVFRTTTGVFFVLTTANNTFQAVQFGQEGDEPVARDYNGDGRTDFAVVRRENGVMNWFILTNGTANTNNFRGERFGADTDVVAPGDYDGDGRFDLAVFRGQNDQAATFFVQQSTAGFTARQFGLGSDLVVPGDYDGDGRTDFAVVRTGSTYTWFILRSTTNSFFGVQFGQAGDFTTQADYDGDGRTDISVYRAPNRAFFTLRSRDNSVETVLFGQNGDIPVANYNTF